MTNTDKKTKVSRLGIILAVIAVVLEIAALLLMKFDDSGFLYAAVLPLAGFVSHFACLKLSKPSHIGLAVLCGLLILLFPFALDSPHWWTWWFGLSVIMFYIALFFTFLIMLGWALGAITSIIVKTKRDRTNKERALESAKLTVLFLIAAAVLCAILNLFFGNPITAYIAGSEMRDWVEDQAEDQAEDGQVYEILGDFLPRYSWYGAEYVFDVSTERGRGELQWHNGEIEFDDSMW